ncbi:hypothetical protein ACHAXR_003403, partial [Thalassiosira sp. AJA248-18]
GDGDLSFSLALKRAYPRISITSSTLVESAQELCRTYANSIETCKELQELWNEHIIYGIDATKLGEQVVAHKEEEKFDIVLFNLPHLGDATLLESEQRHAERHYSLLSHYFFSAKKVLKPNGGRIHVCLSGCQPKSWNVMTAAENNELQCVSDESTAYPVDKWLFKDGSIHELAEVQPHYPTPRKFRNGSLGSKHFLARYGYRHQRTEGDLFDGSVKHINVGHSINFVFACKAAAGQKVHSLCEDEHACSVCKIKFETSEQLSAHLDELGLPDIVTGAYQKKNENTKQRQTDSSNNCKKQPDTSPTFKPINIEDATILIEATVNSEFDSKRIKWLCRQDEFPLSRFIKSKSQCEKAIARGRVFVNQQIALDSGRIVRENDVVSLVEEYEPADDSHKTNDGKEDLGVRFVKQVPIQNNDVTIEIVYKPVGVRCVGSFSPTTLEMITKKHAESSHGMNDMFCHPLSKLDTGCAGLCVLAVSPSKIDEETLLSFRVLYTFTFLVHGTPPDEWRRGVYVKVPTEGLRQWKRQKTNQQENKDVEGKSIPLVTSSTALNLDEALFIKSHDSLQIEDQQLSTLTVQSRFDSGRLANVISFVQRRLGYPVVNDRFGKREYSALPRRMRNIVKHKVCIEVNCVDVDYEGSLSTVSIESHKRTQCTFWKETLS